MTATSLVAKALLFDDEGSLLVLRRSETHPALAHYLDIPGGLVEHNEEPGVAVRREVAEETGLELSALVPIYATAVFSGAVNYPTLLYAAKVPGIAPAIQLSWEHESYEWRPFDALAEVEPQLAPTYAEALVFLSEHKIIESL